MAFQSDSRSDNDNHPRLERLRLTFGGLRRIQRLNEIYHRHRRLFLALHLTVALAAAGLCWWWLT